MSTSVYQKKFVPIRAQTFFIYTRMRTVKGSIIKPKSGDLRKQQSLCCLTQPNFEAQRRNAGTVILSGCTKKYLLPYGIRYFLFRLQTSRLQSDPSARLSLPVHNQKQFQLRLKLKPLLQLPPKE